MAVAVKIPELSVVEFARDLAGHKAGTVGAIVSSHPEDDAYTVEIVDAKGTTLDLVVASGDDLRVTEIF